MRQCEPTYSATMPIAVETDDIGSDSSDSEVEEVSIDCAHCHRKCWQRSELPQGWSQYFVQNDDGQSNDLDDWRECPECWNFYCSAECWQTLQECESCQHLYCDSCYGHTSAPCTRCDVEMCHACQRSALEGRCQKCD